MRMNEQTRIIVLTAVALTAVDLTVRGIFFRRSMPVTSVAQQAGDVVTAREFRLVDNDGNLKAHVYTDENGEPGIVLYDRNGTRRAQLDTFQQVPSLLLFNPEGAWSSYFGMDEKGLGILDMYDQSGSRPAASMSVSGTHSSSLSFQTSSGSFAVVR